MRSVTNMHESFYLAFNREQKEENEELRFHVGHITMNEWWFTL